jgi:Putative beta-barrel porin-2, OmpL-like. bbp2
VGRRAFALALAFDLVAGSAAAQREPSAPPEEPDTSDASTPEPAAQPTTGANAPSSEPSTPAPAAHAAAAPSAATTTTEGSPPFAWGDFTWLNGQSRQKDFPLKAFGDAVTLSLYLDFNYAYSANHPRDNTITSTASVPRHNEIGINLVSIGFDWNYKNIIGRISLQWGEMLGVVQDLDGTAARGRSLAIHNLRYIREAVAGYHFDVGSGLNLEGGIFMSYIGLESYLLAENWNYQRSLICEHTPFYFHGIRAQYYPSDRVKIEPWLMNGWQSYGKWNQAPSAGMATRWSPSEAVTLIGNVYVGTDTKGHDDRIRFHHDDSILVRYYDAPKSQLFSKGAVSLNTHVGFEAGGAGLPGPGGAHVFGSSLVHRAWFLRDHLAFALRGEVFSNPSRYLTQYPPPDFPTGPGVKALQVWGVTGTFDVMPSDFFALRLEGSYRRANAPYFAGPGGTTSPDGFQAAPGTATGFVPDVVNDQLIAVAAVNIRL